MMTSTFTMSRKNILLSSGILLALLVAGATLWGYLTMPSNYLSLDVNPSIEIQTNRLNQVVAVNPVNDDAKQIMSGYQLTDKNLEVVIKNIVDRMILNGYIAPDKDNQILITTDNKNAMADLEKNANKIITAYLEEKQLNASSMVQKIDVEATTIKVAHENGVSAGKMALIEKLTQSDSTLKLEDLSALRISDLIALANSKNIKLDILSGDNKDEGSVDNDQNTIDNKDEGNVNDEQTNIDNKDEGNVNDEQINIDNKDEGNVNDEQTNIDNKDEGNVNDEQKDVNNTDEGNTNDGQDNSGNDGND